MDRNRRITTFTSCKITHITLWLFAFLTLTCPACLYGQSRTNSLTPNTQTGIYIPLRGREEVQISPLPDTLSIEKEYLLRIRFSSRYSFSELFFDRGVAVRTDSFLTIIPKTSMTDGVDTATLRIIGFSNNNRILLYHKFLIPAHPKVFPVLNPNPNVAVAVNNMALERNMKYSKRNFPDKCVFNFLDDSKYAKDNVITAITLSLVNRNYTKNLYVKGNKPTDEMIHEIHKVRNGTTMYVRLDIKNGRKSKSVWTRFTLGD